MVSERAQVASDPFPIATLIIGLAVVGLVGREVVDAQRDALEQCAPGCELGAPLFGHVGPVEGAIVAGVLLAAAIVPLLVRRRWGEGDG